MTKLYFAPVPARAVGDLRLSGLEMRLLSAIALHDRFSTAKQKSGCWAGLDTLAHECGINYSRASTGVSRLVRLGYIEKDRNPKNRRRHVLRVIYNVHDKAMVDGMVPPWGRYDSLPVGKDTDDQGDTDSLPSGKESAAGQDDEGSPGGKLCGPQSLPDREAWDEVDSLPASADTLQNGTGQFAKRSKNPPQDQELTPPKYSPEDSPIRNPAEAAKRPTENEAGQELAKLEASLAENGLDGDALKSWRTYLANLISADCSLPLRGRAIRLKDRIEQRLLAPSGVNQPTNHLLGMEDETVPSFGAEVLAARKRRRWTQQMVADLTGISRGALSNIETGRFPAGPAAMRALATVLEIQPWQP